jgi:predicted nucleotidyltransferase
MRAGTAYLYKLNEEHVLVNGALARLFGAEQDLIEEYAQAAKKGLGIPVESVILYGSVARGTESPGSDVDLMFIVRDARTAERGREQLGSLTASLARKFGSVPQIVFSDVPGFRNGVKRRDPYYSSVLREGRVLYGKALAELLRNGA